MNTNAHVANHRSHGFGTGLLAGTFVGAGLLMWLAPRIASELRQRATETADRLRRHARARYRDVSSQVGDTLDELTRKAQGVRDEAAAAVAHGAHEVERIATAAKSPTRDGMLKL